MKPFGNTSFECQALLFVAVTLSRARKTRRTDHRARDTQTGAFEVGQGSTIRFANDSRRKCIITGFFSLQIVWPALATAFELDVLEDMHAQGE